MRDHRKFYANAAPLNYGDLAMVCRAFGYKITPDDLFEMASATSTEPLYKPHANDVVDIVDIQCPYCRRWMTAHEATDLGACDECIRTKPLMTQQHTDPVTITK